MRKSTTTTLLALALGLAGMNAQAALVRIACGATGQELELCKQSAEEWAKKNRQ